MADAFESKAKISLKQLRKIEGIAPKIDVPPERVFAGFDAYRQAIDAGPDVVLLATPPGFRPIHYAAAVAAGKHVFMEKPCCVDAPGFRSFMESNKLADEKGLKVVVGLQRRHSPEFIDPVKKIQDGSLGDLTLMRAYWNQGAIWIRRRRPSQTEMEYQMRNWYYFNWLSGDFNTEQHVHSLDKGSWAMGDQPPIRAWGTGGRQVRTDAKYGDDSSIRRPTRLAIRWITFCGISPSSDIRR